MNGTQNTPSAEYPPFEYRIYSRKELGCLYFPWYKDPSLASRALSRLIKSDPALLQALTEAGYRKGIHNFSPSMTVILVTYLGTPEEFRQLH